MGSHTGGTDEDTKAVFAGILGELGSGSGGAVGAENVGFIGDTEGLQLLAGSLTTGQSESDPIITATFFKLMRFSFTKK